MSRRPISRCPRAPTTEPGSPFALNDKLANVEVIGLAEVEGPEDVIVDRNGHLYCGNRYGDVVRFFGPDHKRWEIFAHIGGGPLGLAFDRDDNLVVCVSGMGLYMVRPDREVVKLTDETNRSWFSIIDDSRMRFADDLDIAPDGRIFFSEATLRFDITEWAVDALEARGNGRILCYDPRNKSTRTLISNLQFPNGICVTNDGQSILFAETWGCRVQRYWFAGPKAGKRELVIDNLPGYPDNINRASDGNYWLALVGMRSPAFDLAWRMPDLRQRMVNRIPHDEWLYPNMNTGCVFKFDETGRILDCLWDRHGDQPSDDHLDARGPRLPLHRRHLQQPHRQVAHSRRRRKLGRRSRAIGGRSDRRAAKGAGFAARRRRLFRSPCRRWTARSTPTTRWRTQPRSRAPRRRTTSACSATGFCSPAGPRSACSAPSGALHVFDAPVTSLAAHGPALAAALASGGIVIRGGAHDGVTLLGRRGPPARLRHGDGLRRAGRAADLPRLGEASARTLEARPDRTRAQRLGVAGRSRLRHADAAGAKTRLPVRRDAGRRRRAGRRELASPADPAARRAAAGADAVGPAGLSRAHSRRAADGGAWLALFAPRRQLTEFILREPTYRQRMMAEIAPDYWVGPTLAPMASFLEPLQGGTLKKLAAIKPWAPSRSYGLVVRLDAQWQPVASYHSRADGSRHGVTSALERQGRLYAASRGANAVVAVDLTDED